MVGILVSTLVLVSTITPLPSQRQVSNLGEKQRLETTRMQGEKVFKYIAIVLQKKPISMKPTDINPLLKTHIHERDKNLSVHTTTAHPNSHFAGPNCFHFPPDPEKG